MSNQPPLSFDEFPIPDYETWYETTVAALKDVSFDKHLTTLTYEGLVLQPLYRRDDLQGIDWQKALPGAPPFVRGTQSTGYKAWTVAQALFDGTPEAFNTALRHDLEQGQTAINLVLDGPAQSGLDPDSTQPGEVGQGGISIVSVDDLAQALAGIDLGALPLFIQTGAAALPVTALLAAYIQQSGHNQALLKGGLDCDPLGRLARIGTLPQSLEHAYNDMAEITRWTGPDFATIGVNTTVYHHSGANAVQELAFALATGVEYIRQMLDRGLNIEAIASHMRFTFAIGSNFFMEIAKLRAARSLWSQAVRAFGGSENAQKMTIHACSSLLNKTKLDPYVNMLRTTVETFAGAVGGSDSMQVAPFDAPIRGSDEFSRRIARNQQLILQAESNVNHVADPAGGAWYVEMLTDWLAHAAWEKFQEIEADGWMFAALKSRVLYNEVTAIAEKRQTNVDRRKDVLVGTNMYANIQEKPLADNTDYEAIFRARVAAVQQYRSQHDATTALNHLRTSDTSTRLENAINAAAHGATLGEISVALWADSTRMASITPFTAHRLSEPFEKLRQAANNYAAHAGHPPQIFLANMGPLRQHKARTDFAVGFYEVGGYEMLNPGGFATPVEAAEAAITAGAPVVIICSTDETYPDIVPSLVQQIKAAQPDIYIILAGYPQDQIIEYEAVGVDDFIHIRSNCYQMNHKLHQYLGVLS